jgi:predicted GH43/DUF377 family glycosyl hydrolase
MSYTALSWQKKGLIYAPDGTSPWAKHTVLTPTPFLLNDKTIRIFCGFRDDAGITRIGFIDVDSSNPSRVLRVSDKPILDIGESGRFDDNGMLLGDVVRVGETLRMYYVGFQIPTKAKFMAFSGLAISTDNGETFIRHAQVPVMDRSEAAPFIRAIHTVLFEDGIYKVWYSIGEGWEIIGGVPYPRYRICYTESPDGLTFSAHDEVVLDCNEGEYRIGRPRVRRMNGGYEMRFTSDTYEKYYSTGIAYSTDGKVWQRGKPDLAPSPENSWESQTICYPVVLEAHGKTYIFYSGNEMGRTGVGYAELLK